MAGRSLLITGRKNSRAMREKPSIPEGLLQACLQEQYDLFPVTFDFLPLGLDTNTFVYRIVSEFGTSYVLKARLGSIYAPSCLVPGYLRDQGITSVVAPFPTKRNTFFQGYGETEIDWIALTYYRYERVVQDLIACAQEVFFRDDLGEKTRADAVQLVQVIFAEGGEFDAARAAAAHLPSYLSYL